MDNVMQRSLTMLNENGDTTITWPPENDDKMLAIIERKMAAGITFYLVPVRAAGQRGRVAKPSKLKSAEAALKYRSLSIPDEDFSKFVLEGLGEAVPAAQSPAEPLTAAKAVQRAKTAREVASGNSVGVRPRVGG